MGKNTNADRMKNLATNEHEFTLIDANEDKKDAKCRIQDKS